MNLFQTLLEKKLIWDLKHFPRPLRVFPRLQEYIWGAAPQFSYILNFLGIDPAGYSPQARIAELWLGSHPKNPAIIKDGYLTTGLDRLLQKAGKDLLGYPQTHLKQLFKILDARSPLSFQMHDREQPHAKSECWMVLVDLPALSELTADKTIAEIYLGMRADAQPADKQVLTDPATGGYRQYYGQVLENSRGDTQGKELKQMHNWIQVRWEKRQLELYFNGEKQPAEIKRRLGLAEGHVLLNIPGATVHALEFGTVFEVQEAVDKTLRVYDYGRNDPNRPLQIQEAVEKIDILPRSPLAYCLEPVAWDACRTNLICDAAYALDKISLSAGVTYAMASADYFHMLVVLSGSGELSYSCGRKQHSLPLAAGVMLILPVTLTGYTLTADKKLVILKVYQPSIQQQQFFQMKRGQKFWEMS